MTSAVSQLSAIQKGNRAMPEPTTPSRGDSVPPGTAPREPHPSGRANAASTRVILCQSLPNLVVFLRRWDPLSCENYSGMGKSPVTLIQHGKCSLERKECRVPNTAFCSRDFPKKTALRSGRTWRCMLTAENTSGPRECPDPARSGSREERVTSHSRDGSEQDGGGEEERGR